MKEKQIFFDKHDLLLFAACLMLAIFFLPLESLPPYTKWAIIFFVLPSICLIFRRHSRLRNHRFVIVIALSTLATIFWDSVAIGLNIWGFPPLSVSGWFLGVPIEEYIFAIWFCTITLGIYTSLPRVKKNLSDGPRLHEIPLLSLVFVLQLIVLFLIFYSNAGSYIKWLSFFAIIPSLFYLWRKGEKIDEMRLLITCCLLVLVTIVVDLVFITANSWYYYDSALLGRFGIVPIDDILFSIFTAITIVGTYTSLPRKHTLTGRW